MIQVDTPVRECYHNEVEILRVEDKIERTAICLRHEDIPSIKLTNH
jgi:hypothetical protein